MRKFLLTTAAILSAGVCLAGDPPDLTAAQYTEAAGLLAATNAPASVVRASSFGKWKWLTRDGETAGETTNSIVTAKPARLIAIESAVLTAVDDAGGSVTDPVEDIFDALNPAQQRKLSNRLMSLFGNYNMKMRHVTSATSTTNEVTTGIPAPSRLSFSGYHMKHQKQISRGEKP